MSEASPPYVCPLCEGTAVPWHLYPALGLPICDDCDEALLDEPAICEAACRIFSVTPSLLAQIIEHQPPVRLTAAQLAGRFRRRPHGST